MGVRGGGSWQRAVGSWQKRPGSHCQLPTANRQRFTHASQVTRVDGQLVPRPEIYPQFQIDPRLFSRENVCISWVVGRVTFRQYTRPSGSTMIGVRDAAAA